MAAVIPALRITSTVERPVVSRPSAEDRLCTPARAPVFQRARGRSHHRRTSGKPTPARTVSKNANDAVGDFQRPQCRDLEDGAPLNGDEHRCRLARGLSWMHPPDGDRRVGDERPRYRLPSSIAERTSRFDRRTLGLPRWAIRRCSSCSPSTARRTSASRWAPSGTMRATGLVQRWVDVPGGTVRAAAAAWGVSKTTAAKWIALGRPPLGA